MTFASPLRAVALGAVVMANGGELPAVVIAFDDVAEADRRIAGMSVLGRQVMTCIQAGLSRVTVHLPADARLAKRTIEDLGRLRRDDSEVRLVDGPLPEFPGDTLHSVRPLRLLRPDLLLHFARSGGASLTFQGESIVARADPTASGAMEVPADAVIALERPGASHRVLLQCGKPMDGLISRYLNRPVSRRISGVLLRIPDARPMHATAMTALLAIGMFAALLSGGPWGLALGGLLYQAASIVDGVDGEMARATARSSRLGAAADSLIDMATNLAFLLGVAIHAFHTGDMAAVHAGIAALLTIPVGLALIGATALARGEPLGFDLVKHRISAPGAGNAGWRQRLGRLGVILTSRDCYALVFSLLAIFGLARAILFLVALAALIWVLVVLVVLGGLWFRDDSIEAAR